MLPSRYYARSANCIDQYSVSLHREILLLYRLLFGQSAASRGLLTDLLDQLRTTTGDVDPFLRTLCTEPLSRGFLCFQNSNANLPSALFPSSNVDINGMLMESDTYSAQDDFPVFGSRMLALQSYNLRQRPSRVKDLWRDRRKPLQWYTFWIVLWLGGATIVMGILQILLSAAQLYFLIRPR